MKWSIMAAMNRAGLHLAIVLPFGPLAWAGNPIVPDAGMADPHVYVFEGRAYNYATRDADPTSRKFNMPDWQIWSSDDLVNWRHERVIKPEETYIGKPSDGCWAPDAAARNGKYYFYFSNETKDTGVLVADHPAGPFSDPLGKPLLPEGLTPTMEYDPSVLVDGDAAYICFGRRVPNSDYYLARLNDDMVSLAEKPKVVEIKGEGFGRDDKPTLHKHKELYYLSYGDIYATSKNVYGPYEARGESGKGEYADNAGLTRQAHGNYFEWNNQSFHAWCRFIDRKKARYRDSWITYVHYKENGEMLDDVDHLEKHGETGVGQYRAAWDAIQAEWYMAAEKVQKKEKAGGGFEIADVRDGGTLHFPNVAGLKANAAIVFNVAAKDGSRIEVREGRADGKLLGSCTVAPTGGWSAYKEVSCALQNAAGTVDLWFVFKGTAEDLVHVDSFRFEP